MLFTWQIALWNGEAAGLLEVGREFSKYCSINSRFKRWNAYLFLLSQFLFCIGTNVDRTWSISSLCFTRLIHFEAVRKLKVMVTYKW
jgi:hypothetical protein